MRDVLEAVSRWASSWITNKLKLNEKLCKDPSWLTKKTGPIDAEVIRVLEFLHAFVNV